MFLVPYTIYRWTPPELSWSEKIWLGEEVAKVGRKAFVTSLKRRLGAPALGRNNNKSFTFVDVLRDAEMLNNGSQPRLTMRKVLVALLFFGGCLYFIAAAHQMGRFVVAMLVVGPVSGGSLLWMYNKVDRWAQSLIDDYTHAIANGTLRGAETGGDRLTAEAAPEPVRSRFPEHGPRPPASVQFGRRDGSRTKIRTN